MPSLSVAPPAGAALPHACARPAGSRPVPGNRSMFPLRQAWPQAVRRWCAGLAAAAALTGAAPAARAQALPPPPVTARSWLLYDVTSGQVLASHQPDLKADPASLTKLMTAYLAFTALRDQRVTLEDRPPVSRAAYKAIGSRMFLEPAKPATVDELLNGMIVQSGNDASIALAEAVSGSEETFTQAMNQTARRLGMANSSFTNATGLPDAQHYSTAGDMAKLAVRIIEEFPQFYPLYSKRQYTYNGITQPNRNRLLGSDPSVDGMKTGHTDAAGWCLIASARRDQRSADIAPVGVAGAPADAAKAMPAAASAAPAGAAAAGAGATAATAAGSGTAAGGSAAGSSAAGATFGRRLLTVVLGAPSDSARMSESQKLLNYGFQNFDAVRLYAAGQPAGGYEVWKGAQRTLPAGFEQDVVITVPKGQAGALRPEIERMQPLVAPIAKGQKIGTLRVRLGENVLAERTLVALAEMPAGSWFARAWDSLRLMLK